MFSVQGLVFSVRVQDSGFSNQGLGLRVEGWEFRLQALGVWVQGFRFCFPVFCQQLSQTASVFDLKTDWLEN